jgi:hypothetical protein
MTNLLQKMMFWRGGDKPESPVAVPEQRPNDDLDARKKRAEDVDEHFRKQDDEDDSPRPDYEP